MDNCVYEATLPPDTTFEQMGAIVGDGQFCRWTSFPERRFIGLTGLIQEQGKLSDRVFGEDQTERFVCNLESVKAVATSLAPVALDPPYEGCHTTLQLFSSQQVSEAAPVLRSLREYCFRVKKMPAHGSNAAQLLLAVGAELKEQYSLPVRFISATQDGVRVWFDADDDAPWAKGLPQHAAWALANEGVQVASCDEL